MSKYKDSGLRGRAAEVNERKSCQGKYKDFLHLWIQIKYLNKSLLLNGTKALLKLAAGL